MCVRAPSSALGGHTESCSVRWLTAPGCLVKLLPALPAWGRVQPLPCCAFWQNQCRSFPWHGGVTVPALLLTGEGLPGPWGLLRQCVASVGLTVALFRGRDDFVAVLFFFFKQQDVWGLGKPVWCELPHAWLCKGCLNPSCALDSECFLPSPPCVSHQGFLSESPPSSPSPPSWCQLNSCHLSVLLCPGLLL